MVAEIISIGTELLLGSTVDSDSAFLGRTLAALGIDLFFKQTAGDNLDRVVAAIRHAAARAELIVTSFRDASRVFIGSLGNIRVHRLKRDDTHLRDAAVSVSLSSRTSQASGRSSVNC
jgi:molybdopterin biosynthesis enzyme